MTRHSTILGTPGYLAPEQLAGADPDPRQDLYAVGAVAAELVTGERPGADGKIPYVDGPLDEFIRRCTAADPAGRPESAAEAGRLLAATGVLAPARSTPWADDPDSPEVFDQLPPLPPEWTPAGPRPERPESTPARPRHEQQVGTRVGESRLAHHGVPQSPAGPGASEPRPEAVSTLVAPQSGGRSTAVEPAGRETPPGSAGRAPSAGRSNRALRWIAASCFAGGAALLATAAWLLLR